MISTIRPDGPVGDPWDTEELLAVFERLSKETT